MKPERNRRYSEKMRPHAHARRWHTQSDARKNESRRII